MRSLPATVLHISTIAVLAFVVACGDSPTAPGIQAQVVNDTDTFSYQVSDLEATTGSWSYTWQNTGSLAKVTHASDAGATGTATVTIRDGAGTEVYSGSLETSGEVVTSPAGEAGGWSITVTYSDYTNTQVNFAVIKE